MIKISSMIKARYSMYSYVLKGYPLRGVGLELTSAGKRVDAEIDWIYVLNTQCTAAHIFAVVSWQCVRSA